MFPLLEFSMFSKITHFCYSNLLFLMVFYVSFLFVKSLLLLFISQETGFYNALVWKKRVGEEAKPTIDVVVRLAKILDTTVGYLLGEREQADLFKDKKMLQRLQDIAKLPEKEKSSILLTLDHFIKAAKISLL